MTEITEIYPIAKRLHVLNDKRAVRPLIRALMDDANPHRRHGAARALGWIRNRGRTATLALVRCLADRSQPLAAREEAADSIGFLGGTREPVEALLSALDDPSALIRFRAVTGLGNYLADSTVVQALESRLDDSEVPTNAQCWSVGKEALRLLRNTERYRDRCETEAAGILKDPNATPEDRRWAESYGNAECD